jgi:hypothetical protein
MRAWITTGGGIIEDSNTLAAQLVAPTYGFNQRDEIQLERKEDIKKRLGATGDWSSPDWADALALTFSFPVVATPQAGREWLHLPVSSDYDPFATERITA